MSLPVFHAPLDGVRAGDSVELVGDEGRHAVVVKRIRAGEYVELTDGTGTRARARVGSTGKSSLTATVSSVIHEDTPAPRITVVQAIPKGERGELAVELLTEAGVDEILPWAASRCVAVWKGERAAKSHARWESTARSAAKQARRAHWPLVRDKATTAQVVEILGQADLAVVLHEEGSSRLSALPVEEAGSIVVVVGPEGGLAPEELAAFADAGALDVRLGAAVMRTSTAGLAAVSALLSRTARWT